MKTKHEMQAKNNELIKENIISDEILEELHLDIILLAFKLLVRCESKPQLNMKQVADLIQPSTPLCEEL